MEIFNAIEHRRTIYNLSSDITISKEKILEIIEYCLKHSPNDFNENGNKIAVLFSDSHQEIWEEVKSSLKKIIPSEDFSKTELKINSFKKAVGTILFFEDVNTIENLQTNFPEYKNNFPSWSEQSSAMLQILIWITLDAEGVGISLQHYTPFLTDILKSSFNIPDNWKLIAQMPFGKKESEPDEKIFSDITNSLKIFH